MLYIDKYFKNLFKKFFWICLVPKEILYSLLIYSITLLDKILHFFSLNTMGLTEFA